MGTSKAALLAAVRAIAPEHDWGTHNLDDWTADQLRELLTRLETARSWHDDDEMAEFYEELPDIITELAPEPQEQQEEQEEEEEEQPMPQATNQTVSPGETSGRFDLEQYIVETATHHRDTILDGLELGGTTNVTHTFSMPDLPEVTFDKAHAKLPLLVKAAGLRRPIMLVGPAGSGKTTAGRQLAEAYDVPFYANSNSPMDTRMLAFGYMDAAGNYHPGYLYRAMKEGGVLLDDEVDSSNPAIMVSKNAAIENRFAQFPNGETVEAHENFIYIGSANTYGRGADRMYVGRTQLDAATLNRFVFVEWDYDEDLEMQLSINPDWTTFVQAVRRVVAQHKMRYVVSPRQSIAGGELLAAGIPEDDVRRMTVFPGWPQEDIDKVIRSL
jgi:hypothetical protein